MESVSTLQIVKSVVSLAISSKTGSFVGYSFAVPSNIAKKVIEDLITENNENFHVIISNTPPQSSDFSNEKTMEWALCSIKIMNTLTHDKRINKVIYAGSCLSLLPLYHSSTYKSIKILELKSFIDLKFSNFKKNSFVILPPMGKGKEKKFNLLEDSYCNGAKLIIKAITKDKQIILVIIYQCNMVAMINPL